MEPLIPIVQFVCNYARESTAALPVFGPMIAEAVAWWCFLITSFLEAGMV